MEHAAKLELEAGTSSLGIPADFESLYRANAPNVRRLVHKLGISHTDSDDVVQDVFVILYQKFPSALSDDVLKKVLHAITIRVSSNHRRAFARCRLRGRADPDVDITALAHDVSREPDLEAVRNERLATLLCAIDQLDAEKREVLTLTVMDALTAAELGTKLRMRPGTVASRLRAARQRLHRRLGRRRNE